MKRKKKLTAQDIWGDKKRLGLALQGCCPIDILCNVCPIYEKCRNESQLIKQSAAYEKRRIQGQLTLDDILGLV